MTGQDVINEIESRIPRSMTMILAFDRIKHCLEIEGNPKRFISQSSFAEKVARDYNECPARMEQVIEDMAHKLAVSRVAKEKIERLEIELSGKFALCSESIPDNAHIADVILSNGTLSAGYYIRNHKYPQTAGWYSDNGRINVIAWRKKK